MDSRSLGLLIVGAGVLVILVGLLVMSGGLGWFGRLPGDIRIERENVQLYFPLASVLIVSAVLSLLMYFLRRFL
jgi:hypothetical protein